MEQLQGTSKKAVLYDNKRARTANRYFSTYLLPPKWSLLGLTVEVGSVASETLLLRICSSQDPDSQQC